MLLSTFGRARKTRLSASCATQTINATFVVALATLQVLVLTNAQGHLPMSEYGREGGQNLLEVAAGTTRQCIVRANLVSAETVPKKVPDIAPNVVEAVTMQAGAMPKPMWMVDQFDAQLSFFDFLL